MYIPVSDAARTPLDLAPHQCFHGRCACEAATGANDFLTFSISGMASRAIRYTDQQKAEALRYYRAGYSCRAAGEKAGVGFRAVAKWAGAAGLTRPRTERSTQHRRQSEEARMAAARRRVQERKRARQDQIKQMRALRRQGMTFREIGERVGLSRQATSRWLRP